MKTTPSIQRRKAMAWGLALGATLALPARAATAWPSRPVRVIAGGVGSITDIRSRWLAPRLSAALGQQVLVENLGGAGGNLSAIEVARSAPDGHTLLTLHQGTAAINPHLYAKPGYDPLTELLPVTRFGHGSLLLAVHPAVAARSMAELLALMRDKPGAINFGSPGIGTPPHMAAEFFIRQAGVKATHVPYRSGGALMAALLTGEVSWSMEGLTGQLPHVRNGALRPLAVTGSKRSPSLPDVPTVAEAGLAGFAYEGWTGYAVAAGTPAAIVERLQREIGAIAATDECREWFAKGGAEAGILTPAEMADLVRTEHARFGKLIREAGWRAE
jgi:tripartite-type tricarboxylate transporter receptor subunit TctC